MPRANEIKKGMVLNYNGKLLIVKDIDIQAPSARGAATLYKMRFADVRTGLKVEERFKGDDIVDTVTLTRRYVDFSYVDGNEYVFMDKEDYTPYIFTKDQIEEELLFIPEGGMPDMQVLTCHSDHRSGCAGAGIPLRRRENPHPYRRKTLYGSR